MRCLNISRRPQRTNIFFNLQLLFFNYNYCSIICASKFLSAIFSRGETASLSSKTQCVFARVCLCVIWFGTGVSRTTSPNLGFVMLPPTSSRFTDVFCQLTPGNDNHNRGTMTECVQLYPTFYVLVVCSSGRDGEKLESSILRQFPSALSKKERKERRLTMSNDEWSSVVVFRSSWGTLYEFHTWQLVDRWDLSVCGVCCPIMLATSQWVFAHAQQH